ncbi:diguanylate cyclase (GGDEF domain) [hydrothermal vent metagenome]|uniref:Diguanylate cyclase (GGDEF domain) n=1 Tax=hydrothermal vent metagenome TaxID=652676 RepID=A0A3B0SPZ0_9ZZZZ
MQLNLRNNNDVRLFTITISVIALISNAILQYVFLPADLYRQVIFSGSVVSLMIAMPIAYFVGQRMRDIYQLTERLEYAVNNDKLTGACTRISFYQRLEQFEGLPIALIFADIDHFKGINDKYGHKAGDEALKAFTRTLMDNCRKDDIVARFGGEEFVILLNRSNIADAVVVAHRICAKVRGQLINIKGDEIQITASFGVAEVTSIDQIDKALHWADLATFRAKREGRDQVCAYDPVRDPDIAVIGAAE